MSEALPLPAGRAARVHRWAADSLAPVRRWAADLADPARLIELTGTMTLLLLLRHSEKSWALELGVYALVVVGLLHRPLLRRATFWLLITAFLVYGHAQLWFVIDNHKYLMTYWTLAFGVSMLSPAPAESLRRNGRLFIGLGFGLAVLAKLLSEDYLNGGFFESLLVSDGRFRYVASVLGGVSQDAIRLSDTLRDDLMIWGDLTRPVEVPVSPRLALLAQVMTWWTLLIEGLVAVLFFWPEGRGPSRWRDAALLVFMATTYPIAPVIGFAWTLAAMGAAQADRSRHALWVLLYVAAFVLLMMTRYLPFARFLGLS